MVLDSSHLHNEQCVDIVGVTGNNTNFIRNTAGYGFADDARPCSSDGHLSLLDAQSMMMRQKSFFPVAVTPTMERGICFMDGGCVLPNNNRNETQPGLQLSAPDECNIYPLDPTHLTAPFLSSSVSLNDIFSTDLVHNDQPYDVCSSRAFSVQKAVSSVPAVQHRTGDSSQFKPSDFLRARLHSAQESSQPPQKKIKTQNDAALHRACLQSEILPQQIMKLLKQDPEAATRSIPIFSNKQVVNALTRTTESRVVKEPYTYPLHLAIQAKASFQVIQQLIDAAPQVLLIPDGAMKETPLHVLLKQCPDVTLVDSILLTQPKCVLMRDRHDNTVLHLACQRGVTQDVLRHLCILFPRALQRINLHGKTPLQLAQRATHKFAEASCNFLMALEEGTIKL